MSSKSRKRFASTNCVTWRISLIPPLLLQAPLSDICCQSSRPASSSELGRQDRWVQESIMYVCKRIARNRVESVSAHRNPSPSPRQKDSGTLLRANLALRGPQHTTRSDVLWEGRSVHQASCFITAEMRHGASFPGGSPVTAGLGKQLAQRCGLNSRICLVPFGARLSSTRDSLRPLCSTCDNVQRATARRRDCPLHSGGLVHVRSVRWFESIGGRLSRRCHHR